MNIKEHVFRYLDLLFSKAEQVGSIDEGFKMGWVNEDNDTILSIVNQRTFLYKQNKIQNLVYPRLSIHFSFSEFHFIVNMFSIDEGEAVDLIKDYISNILIRGINLSLSPFHPYL